MCKITLLVSVQEQFCHLPFKQMTLCNLEPKCSLISVDKPCACCENINVPEVCICIPINTWGQLKIWRFGLKYNLWIMHVTVCSFYLCACSEVASTRRSCSSASLLGCSAFGWKLMEVPLPPSVEPKHHSSGEEGSIKERRMPWMGLGGCQTVTSLVVTALPIAFGRLLLTVLEGHCSTVT